MEFGATIKDVITRKTIVLFAVFIMAALVLVGATPQAEGALEAEYHMDDNTGQIATDSSGNGHDLTLGALSLPIVEGVDPTWNGSGILGSALTFDGDDYIQSFGPGTVILNGEPEISVEAWINLNSTSGTNSTIIAGYNDLLSVYNLYVNNSGYLVFDVLDNGSSLIQVTSTTAIPQHQWLHVVGTYDSSSISLYVNGNFNASTPTLGDHVIDATGTVYTYIGGDIPGTVPYNGTIDLARIYTHALSSLEVVGRYNVIIPTPAHNLDMGTHHTTIQKAIDNATPGDRISVDPGTYNESINITIPLELIGTDASNTTIDGIGSSTAINITGDFVEISGFTIKNSTAGIHLDTNVNNCSIFDNAFESITDYNIEIMSGATMNDIYNNTITGGDHGIYLSNAASYIMIDDNTIVGTTTAGIYEENMGPAACNNTFSNNTLDNTGSYGIFLDETHDIIIENNWINNTGDGIYLFQNTYDNTIYGNTIMNCTTGVNLALLTTNSNLIYGNNFITNTVHAVDAGTNNRWNETYVNGAGNYWDTYTGADDGSGSGFHALFGDNIGDTLLPHPAAGFDEYPWTAIDGSTLPQDTVAPMVTINLPLDSVFYAGIVSINATINDTEGNGVPATYQYNIDGGAWQNLALDSGDWYIATNDTTYLTDGAHTINFKANDTIGHLNNTESVTIFVDNTPATSWLEFTGPTYMMEEMMDTNLTVTGATQNILPLAAPLVLPQIFGPDLVIAPGTLMLYQEMTLSGVTSGTTESGTVNMVARSTLVWQPAHPLEGKGFTSGMIEWTNLGGTGWFNGTFASEHNMFVSSHGMMYSSGEGIYIGDHFEGEFNGLQSPDYAFLNISMQFHMGAWIRDTTTVTVNATDLADAIPYSGGVQIHYNTWNESMGWAGWTTGAVDTPVSVMFSEEGTNYLNWYTTDANGTQSMTYNQTYIVDNTAPTTTSEIGEPQVIGSGGMIEYINETFDAPPIGWSLGPGWGGSITNNAGGIPPFEIIVASVPFTELTTPPQDTTGSTTLFLEFKEFWNPVSGIREAYITDGIIPPVPIPLGAPFIQNSYVFDITPFIGPGTTITFSFSDPFFTDQWFVDDVILRGDGGGGSTWITSTTPIYLNSTDGGVSPVGVYNITYNIWNTTTGWQGLTTGADDTNLTLSGFDEDNYFIEFYATDALGNTEITQNISFIVDNTAPTTTIEFGEPKQGANPVNISSTTMLYLNSTDAGIGDYNITYRAWNASAGWTTWTFGGSNTNITLTNYDEGLNFIEYYATDILGNKENTHNETFVVDNTDPTTTLIFGIPQQGSNPINITSSTPIYLNATDGPFGSYNITYRVWNESTGWSGWTTGATDTNLTIYANEEGLHYVEFYATDIMGNVETLLNETFMVDDTSPSTTLEIGEPSVTGSGGTIEYLNESFDDWVLVDWTIDPFWTLSGTNSAGGDSDPEAWALGIGFMDMTTPAFDTTSSTTLFLEFDEFWLPFVGGRSVLITDGIIAPVPLLLPGGPGIPNHYVLDITSYIGPGTTIIFRFDDPLGGLDVWFVDDVILHGDGGGSSTWITDATPIYLNSTDGGLAPVGGYNITYNIWNTTTGWQGLTTGADNTNLTLTGFDEDNYFIEYYATDALGNTEMTQNISFKVDNTAPTTNYNVGTPFYGPNHVKNTTEIELVANDASGVGMNATYFRIWNSTSGWTTWTVFTANFTLEGTDGTRYLEFYSDDLLGNKEIVNNYTFFVDHTGPAITINSPMPMEQFRGPMPINATFTDQIGNASTYMYQIDGGAWIPLVLDSGDWYNGTNDTNYLSYGNHELNITGMDELGNSFSVNVTFLGRLFVQNIDTGNDYYTLQEAIDNATSGDTLIVAPGTYPENITVNKTIHIVNSSFLLVGNVTIDPLGSLHFDNVSIDMQNFTINGTLTMDNSPNTIISNNVWINAMVWVNGSTWEMNNTYDGQYNITVNGTGGMIIQSNSTIRSTTGIRYMFTIASGATFRVENSTIRDSGWDWPNIGLIVMTDNAYLYNATLTNNYNGISIVNAEYVQIYQSDIYRNDASGVYIENGNYTQIYYTNITDGYSGVNIDSGNYTEIFYSNISFATKDGIYIYNGNGNAINYTTIFNNSNNGISLDAVNNSYIYNSSVYNNSNNGIYIYLGNNTDIYYSNITNNDEDGIYLENTEDTNIYYSNITNNDADGIDAEDDEYTYIYYSNVSYNDDNGVEFDDSYNNSIYHSILIFNDGEGINVGSSYSIYVYNNTILNNTEHGVYFDYVDNGEIILNNISSNGENGIMLDEYNEEINIENNYVFDNYLAGIELKYDNSYNDIFNNTVVNNSREGTPPGIGLYEDNYNNTIEQNNISGNGRRGIGFARNNENNVIRNNTITDNMLDGVGFIEYNSYNTIEYNIITNNIGSGIKLRKWNDDNYIVNNTDISNNTDGGIHIIRSSYTTIENNNIMDNQQYGIYVSGFNPGNRVSDIYIINNSIVNNSGYGIEMYYARDVNIQDNLIDNASSFAMYLYIVNGDESWTDNTISNGSTGLYSYRGNFELENCTLVNNGLDLELDGNSYIISLNTTFNKSSVQYDDAISELEVIWYMHTHVLSFGSSPVYNAQVDTWDVQDNMLYSGSTDMNGFIYWWQVVEYIENQSGQELFIPQKVEATDGLYFDIRTFNVDQSMTVTLWLNYTYPPTEAAVTTGLQYDATEVEYDMLIALTQNGLILVHEWDTEVLVTIYDQDMNVVVNADNASVENGTLGLYSYNGSMMSPGTYFVFIDANVSGLHSSGITSFEIVDWIQTINDINATTLAIEANLVAFYADFNSTWTAWNTSFAAYWTDLNATTDGLNITIQAETMALSNQMTGYEANITALLSDISGNISQIDSNLTALDMSMQYYFQTMWNEHNTSQALVSAYWGNWNTTIATLQSTMDFVNTTTLSVEAVLGEFAMDFEAYWNDYNSTTASDLNQLFTWFNTTWNLAAGTEANITALLDALSAQMNTLEGNLTTILAAHDSFLAQVDANITALDAMVASYYLNLLTENNDTQATISAYWTNWNNSIAALQDDVDYVNTSLLSHIASFSAYWVDFNSTWTAWDVSFAAYWADLNGTTDGLNVTIQDETSALSTQMTGYEANITLLLADLDVDLSSVDVNLTNMDATMQSYFQSMWNEHNTSQALVGAYWADWNNTIDALQDDVDYVNTSLLSHIVEFNAYWLDFNTTWTNWESMFFVYWSDYNTTWTTWNTKFDSYWTYFNTTTDGLNMTLRDDILGVHNHMFDFETNMTLLLADLDGDVSSVDANLTSMDLTMQSYFQSMWNEHNTSQTLVSMYWTDWNATMAQLQMNLEFVNLTTLAINSSLTSFRTDFANYWTQFDGNMTEIAMWFTDTWTITDMFEANMTTHLNQQDVNIAAMNSDLNATDALMQQSFMNVYENHTTDRAVFASYWMDWNNTIDAMQMDVDFLNTTLQRVDYNLTTMNDTMVALLSALDMKIDDVNASLEATLASIETNLLSELNMMQSTFLSELAVVNLTLYNEIQSGILSITVDIAGLNASLAQELMDLGDNLTDQHDALEAWLDTAVAGIQDRIDELEQDLLDQLDALNNSLASHDTDVSAQMDDIEQTLIDLRKLDVILGDLEALDTSLDMAEDELTSSLQAHEDKMESRDYLVLILLLITLIIVLVSLIAARKWHAQTQENWENVSVMEDDDLEYEEGELVEEEFFEE